MAISVVQRNSGQDANGTTGSIAVAFGSNNTAGNTIIAIVIGTDTSQALWTSEIGAVTDTRSNTYTQVFNQWDTNSSLGMKVWTASGITAGANTVNEPTDTSNPCALFIYEVSGLQSSPFDQSKFTAISGSATFDSGNTSTTAASDELLLGAFASGTTGAFTAGSGYSNLISQNVGGQGMDATEERIVATTGTYNATATVTLTSGVAAIFTFKGVAASSASFRGVRIANPKVGPMALRRRFRRPRITGTSATTTATGDIKVYNGSVFTAKPVKVWNGSAWVQKPVKVWNGSAWVTTSY